MSVFTYDHEPQRVSSPWLRPSEGPSMEQTSKRSEGHQVGTLGGLPLPAMTRLEDHNISYLDAEPEFGPVEYKLHLLLRPRRQFLYTSTGEANTNPRASPRPDIFISRLRIASETSAVQTSNGGANATPGNVPSPQSRQNRLQHLTTQLLWRLQQSSPYHASSAAGAIVPNLPDASGGKLGAPARPDKLLPGIEESQGAMYELGVNDDGALIGLTHDEMSESLINLRAMAASLGCNVSVLRAVVVGSCQLAPEIVNSSSAPTSGLQTRFETGREAPKTITEDLIVVEALVLPDTTVHPNGHLTATPLDTKVARHQDIIAGQHVLQTEQLRICLTGSTTSGKSSLVGTLLTSTRDNARGKNRLNLLKHHHERASGVTSSVAHELLGYERDTDIIVNYARVNVESWTDVHNAVGDGRLVLLTDSAGHPRYRRTIVRSLVAWQPHWTLCCIAAAYGEENEASSINGSAVMQEDGQLSTAQGLAIAHLELCLRLDLPLVVVITKYDLARRNALKQILSKILDSLKTAGRVPHLLRPSEAVQSDDALHSIPQAELHEVQTLLESPSTDAASLVPIILTSAVTGAGVTKLHALLRQLPIVSDRDEGKYSAVIRRSSEQAEISPVLFNVDEIFAKQIQGRSIDNSLSTYQPLILSGLLERGTINIGDELLLGPHSETRWNTDPRPPLDGRRAASYPVTEHEMAMRRAARFAPRRRRSSEDIVNERPTLEGKIQSVQDGEEDITSPEWCKVRVVSLRNLRLPVQTSFEGQAITIGITIDLSSAPSFQPRKGMVLLRPMDEETSGIRSLPVSCNALQILFDMDAYSVMEPGARFFVYVASIRVQVKVVTVGLVDVAAGETLSDGHTNDGDEDVFQLDSADGQSTVVDKLGKVSREVDTKKIEVVFQLLNSREYMEIGAKVLVMPEQANAQSVGIDGFAGFVSAVYG